MHEATGRCVKQTVTATIVTPLGKRFVGTNAVRTQQTVCPRADYKSGEGYHLCKSVCGQVSHAEIAALAVAGADAIGATLYLEGHTYACEDCTSKCQESGITKIIIGSPPDD